MRWRLALMLAGLGVALALVLSWSFGVFAARAAGCTKVGPGAVKIMDLGMDRGIKLGSVYALPNGGGWDFAARVPGAGVAVWLAYITPTTPMNEPARPLEVLPGRGTGERRRLGKLAVGPPWASPRQGDCSHHSAVELVPPSRRLYSVRDRCAQARSSHGPVFGNDPRTVRRSSRL
jgi:hypothetical protein